MSSAGGALRLLRLCLRRQLQRDAAASHATTVFAIGNSVKASARLRNDHLPRSVLIRDSSRRSGTMAGTAAATRVLRPQVASGVGRTAAATALNRRRRSSPRRRRRPRLGGMMSVMTSTIRMLRPLRSLLELRVPTGARSRLASTGRSGACRAAGGRSGGGGAPYSIRSAWLRGRSQTPTGRRGRSWSDRVAKAAPAGSIAP